MALIISWNIIIYLFLDIRQRWTDEERVAVFNYFKKSVNLNKLASKKECEKLQKRVSILRSRTWSQIKDQKRNLVAKASTTAKQRCLKI